MEDAGLIGGWALALRAGERVTLTLVVIVVALVVTAGFWRSVHKVDLSVAHEKLSGGASLLLATPVMALLALIGFAWVSFSHPVTVTLPGVPADRQAAASGSVAFTGVAPRAASPEDADHARSLVAGRIRSLNCVAAAAGAPLSPRELDALAEVRLALMAPVWDPTWGAFEAFRAWALGRSADPPNAAAEGVFGAIHPLC